MLDPIHLSRFDNDGFTIVEHVFSKDDLDDFAASLARIIRCQLNQAQTCRAEMTAVPEGREFDLGMMVLEAIDHAYVARISDALAGMPEVLRLLSGRKLLSLVRGIARWRDDEPLYCTNGAALLAMPNDRSFTHGWHKDTFYTLPESEYVQIWAPIVQDSTIELGTLCVCPGSHKAGWKGQMRVGGVRNIHKFQVTSEEISKYNPVDVAMKLGQVLIFHPGLAHRGGGNQSDICRFSLVGVYHRVESPKFSAKPKMTADEYYDSLYNLNHSS